MKSLICIIGFICGLAVVAIVYSIIAAAAKKKGGQMEYDERQIAIRGKSFKTGFITFVICQFVVICNEVGIGIHIMDGVLLQFTILLIGLVTFIIHAMWNDAYFQGNGEKKVWIILMLIVIAVNFILFFSKDFSKLKTEDGLLSNAFVNLEIAFFCFVILVNGIIKILIDKKAEKE